MCHLRFHGNLNRALKPALKPTGNWRTVETTVECEATGCEIYIRKRFLTCSKLLHEYYKKGAIKSFDQLLWAYSE